MQYAMGNPTKENNSNRHAIFLVARSKTEGVKRNLGYIGGLVSQTMQIIGQSIIQQRITKESENISSHHVYVAGQY